MTLFLKRVFFGLFVTFAFFYIRSHLTLQEQKASSTPNPVASTNTNTPEFMLATIDGEQSNAGTYTLAINALEPKCQERASTIADMSVATQRLYKEKGIKITNLQILSNLDSSIPSSATGLKCAEVLALLVTAAK